MGQEGVLVTLVNIRHDISDLRLELKGSNDKTNLRIDKLEEKVGGVRDFEVRTSGQFGMIKGIGGTLTAIIVAVAGWSISQIWAHSVTLESLPDFKNRVTEIQGEETKQAGVEASLSGRVDKLETDVSHLNHGK